MVRKGGFDDENILYVNLSSITLDITLRVANFEPPYSNVYIIHSELQNPTGSVWILNINIAYVTVVEPRSSGVGIHQ